MIIELSVTTGIGKYDKRSTQ